jgi:hypothetical protein
MPDHSTSSNIQFPTLNTPHPTPDFSLCFWSAFDVGRWMLGVGYSAAAASSHAAC